MASGPPVVTCTKPATGNGAVSPGASVGITSGAVPEKYSGQPFDLWRFRKVLPGQWMAFLRAHFSDPVHVAYVFGVNERTARVWWEGGGSPRSEVSLAAVKHIPTAAAYLLEAA